MVSRGLYATTAWRTLANRRLALARQADEPCFRCRRPIDWTAEPRTRWAPSVDHLVPIALGGEELPGLEDLAVSHVGCNSRHGARLGHAMRRNGIPNTSHEKNSRETASRPQFLQPGVPAPPTGPMDHSPQGRLALPEPSWSPPRLLTPPHPSRTGSYAEAWVPEVEETLHLKLRPWQRYVLDRGLEHDEAGRLCWLVIAISASRQSGKSWIILALAVMRASHPEIFGEPQEVLHVGNNLEAARRIQQKAWRWAEQHEYQVTRRAGSERITWDTDSTWTLASSLSVWGSSASLAVVDEAWDCHPDVVDHALLPVLVERVQPQLWLFSTANPAATLLFQRYRREAILDRSSDVCLIEWSADPDADFSEEATWRAASPWWHEGRRRLMAAASTKKGFREQWLNVWPDRLTNSAPGGWPPLWGDCPRVQGGPPVGATAAVEVSLDGSVFGAAVATPDTEGGVKVWTASARSLDGILAVLRAWNPGPLLVGASLSEDVVSSTWTAYLSGLKETRAASGVIPDLVKRGRLAHDHQPEVAEEVAGAKALRTEAGIVLSARASVDSVAILKAAVWASWACLRPDDYAAATAQIW